MAGRDLYLKLKKAYSLDNLTLISSGLIELNRNGNDVHLRKIAACLKDVFDRKSTRPHQIFAGLIRLYHPDRYNYYQVRIETHFQQGDLKKLHALDHIFKVLDAVRNRNSGLLSRDAATRQHYSGPVFTGNGSSSANRIRHDYDPALGIRDFFSAYKHLEYGNVDVPLEYHHLEDIDGELDLSSYEIEDLTGLEYCQNITSLDLSNNMISDISLLAGLNGLEELYLAHNDISDVTALAHLPRLLVLDLADNKVSDVSSLGHGQVLEYINLTGNDLTLEQIDALKNRVKIVLS
ncbi:leucine-rich repeat domain-containing protein [bacterium]|nr:leucine-rich repeat domain-containing protein [bacterium]